MKYYASGEELAKDMGVPLQKFVDAHDQHYNAANKQQKDPEGGPYPAYPSGKTWDEPSGKTGSGKKFFHNVITGAQFPNEPYYAAIITPIIHYCMGGLEITTKSEVVGSNGRPIPGLYCAGECMGGVHGNNRLGGNSLLDCVVFGRVAGKACADYAGFKTPTKLSSIAGSSGTGGTSKSALSGGSYEDEPGNPSAKAAAPAAAAPAAAAGGGITLGEVAKHNTEQDCWVVVNGDVLDVTSFLPDHPGGVLAIVTFAGKDASEEFNMIHPPDVISKYAPDAVIGKLGTGAPAAAAAAPAAGGAAPAAVAAAPKAADPYPNNFVTPISLLTLANMVELICCKARGYYK